jgi:hypothetical protein
MMDVRRQSACSSPFTIGFFADVTSSLPNVFCQVRR